MSWFNNKSKKKDSTEPKDENQKSYQDTFGIRDKYLLNYEGEKFIVFIDSDNDIDWVENTDFNGFSEEDKKRFYINIEQLDRAQAYPCNLLDETQIIAFKRILGSAYVAAFHKSFDGISATISEARKYVAQRNLETARQIYLTWAGVFAIIAIAFLVIRLNCDCLVFPSVPMTSCLVLGIAGAYFSIWRRYEDLLMKGFSTRFLLALESVSRLFIGAISSAVVYMAYKCQIVFTLFNSIDAVYVCAFLGFLGGLLERFVPSLVESFANKNLQDKE